MNDELRLTIKFYPIFITPTRVGVLDPRPLLDPRVDMTLPPVLEGVGVLHYFN